MEKKKILIAYASYGSGHKSVANYIYNYFNNQKKFELKVIDIMDYSNSIGKLSMHMFNNSFKYNKSSIFTLIYNIFNHKYITTPYKMVVKAILNDKELKNDIVNFNPDLLISSHFFASTVLGIYNQKKYTNCKIISIITDFYAHEIWLKNKEYEDAIIVSNKIVKNDLINKGVDKHKIYPFGIPISNNFKQVDDINKIKEKYKVNNNLKTYLFFAGGSNGSMFSYTYFKKLAREKFDINIIFVCGKNEELKSCCEDLVKNEGYKNITILGFSNDVNSLLSIADIVITKPGGLSITEALEMKKPTLLIPGIGGQEDYNAKFIVKNGFGINNKSPKALIKNITKLLTRPSLVANMEKKLTKYKENTSVEELYKLANKLLK